MDDQASIGGLVVAGRLVAQRADVAALEAMLDEAARDVAAADANMRSYGSWADAMLYEAALRSARVIVQAAGYRIVARDRAHVTTIDAADMLTGGAHHAVFTRLHRMRRKRNEFMYEATRFGSHGSRPAAGTTGCLPAAVDREGSGRAPCLSDLPLPLLLEVYRDPDWVRPSRAADGREIRSRTYDDQVIEIVVDTAEGTVVTA